MIWKKRELDPISLLVVDISQICYFEIKNFVFGSVYKYSNSLFIQLNTSFASCVKC